MTTDFSGPASGIVLIEGPDHGVQPKPLHNPRGIFYRPRRLYAAPGRRWFASGFYLGPFDESEGVEGAAAFRRENRNYGHAPQVFLTATENAIGVLPRMRSLEPLWILYEEIESIEVRPGPKAKMLLTTPRNAHKIGVVVGVTRHQRRAEFAGRVVGGLAEFFTDLGARAQT